MGNSKVFLGLNNIKNIKFGLQGGKLFLGETKLYPLEKPIGDAVVSCDDATYNGSVQTAQNIVVTLSGVTLVAGTDYTVTSNTGGTNVGTYPIVIAGAGEYTGTTNGIFTINKADSSLLFTVTNLTVGLGETKTNAVTVNAGDGDVTYSSNNTSIVTVNNSGVVTGVGVGNATITANISEGTNYKTSSASYTASCIIAVTAKYNVTSTSSPTRIASAITSFTKIEIDGVTVSPRTGYTFSTTGEHTVKYYLTNRSIGNYAFQNCSGMTSCTIDSGVTSIGRYAFNGCTSLTSVTIPDSITSIGNVAFYDCTSLTSCTIGSGVTSIGTSAFYNCSGLTSIDIPNGVTSIGDETFRACSGLTSCTIGSGVTSIGTSAFYNCTRLTSIDIPDSVTTIGERAFFNCRSLTSCTIGSGVTSIGTSAFYNCTRLTSIDIPNGVTSIDYHTFYGCTSLTSINIPNSVTTIGYEAFESCSSLTSCTIGSGVTSIGDSAFNGCRSLTSITVEATTPPTLGSIAFNNTNNCPIIVSTCSLVPTYQSASGWSSYSSRIAAFDCPSITAKFNVTSTSSPTRIASATTSFASIEIDGVEQSSVTTGYTFSTSGEHTVKYHLRETTIGYSAFTYCINITSIDIPNGVTSIDNNAFYSCTGLTSIDIPDSVTSIGNNAFYQCRSLTSIDIPDSVTSIGNYVFYNCSGLTSCTIGSGVTSIGTSAFYDCYSLTSITVDSNNTTYDSRNNCNAIIETRANMLIQGCNNTVIPNSVTSIGNAAFHNCSGMTSIDIPNGVTSIGTSAFYQCRSLTSIDIPDSVAIIGDNTFLGCSGLTSCTIGSGVTSIGNNTFLGCSGLTSIVCNATTAPTIQNGTFRNVKTGGTLRVPSGSSGYDVWMGTGDYYLGKYNWTKVEQ